MVAENTQCVGQWQQHRRDSVHSFEEEEEEEDERALHREHRHHNGTLAYYHALGMLLAMR